MLRDERFEEHLNAALVTRPTSDQAKGVLVTLRSATPAQVFAELRHAAATPSTGPKMEVPGGTHIRSLPPTGPRDLSWGRLRRGLIQTGLR